MALKKLWALCLIMFLCSIAMAQQKLSFSVLEFEQDMFDTSAKSSEYGKKDGNGSWYAIIKVTSNNPDDDITTCQFNFGNMASKVEKHDEALWVYVQRNAKKVTISRPGYHTISQYDLQTTIEAGANYKMVLTSDRVQQQVVYDVKMQKVKFIVTPAVPGALIMTTNQSTGKELVVGTTDVNGIVYKIMDTGKYTYRVLSSDNLYHPSEGMMTLTSSDETHEEKVLLKPNFAEIKLDVADNAEILINNESKGRGSWSGRLIPGTYIVSTHLKNHRDSQQKIIVDEGVAQNVILNSPIPITGVLTINSTPYEAKVLIDGKRYGQAPLIIKDMIIGQHSIVVRKTGYGDYSSLITVQENKTAQIEAVLTEVTNAVQERKETIIPNTEQEYADLGNAHEFVDLGLPSGVLWATCNIGASTPDGYGSYFAWGELSTKSSYSESNYMYSDRPTTLPLDRDVAHVEWGGKWRLPSSKEFKELKSKCNWTWTSYKGTKGYLVTSKKNGNSIFLPAANRKGGFSTTVVYGYYWSSSIDSSSTSYAIGLGCGQGGVFPDKLQERYFGQSIRPVMTK